MSQNNTEPKHGKVKHFPFFVFLVFGSIVTKKCTSANIKKSNYDGNNIL